MSLGLLTRASSGWRRVIGTGSSGGSTGSSRGSARSKTVHFKRPALYGIVIFLRVRALADQNGSFLKAGLGLWYGSGRYREVQNGSFLKAGLVQNRHVTSCRVTSRRVTSRLVMSRHVVSRHVASCHVLSCHVLSRHDMSCHVM